MVSVDVEEAGLSAGDPMLEGRAVSEEDGLAAQEAVEETIIVGVHQPAVLGLELEQELDDWCVVQCAA